MLPEFKTSKVWIPITFYASLAFALSAWLLQFMYFIGDDGVYYARVGANLLAGKRISANAGEPYTIHPPLFPFLIGLANLVFRNLEFSGHFISMLAFALTLIPLFLLAREIYPPTTPHWVSLLYLANGFLLLQSNWVMTESLFTLLVLTFFYLIHKVIQGDSPRLSGAIGAGIFGGAACLTRPEGLFFYAAGITGVLLLAPASRRFNFQFASLSLLIFLLFFIPQIFFQRQASGQWQLSGGVTEILIKRQMTVSPAYSDLEGKKIYEGLTSDKRKLKMEELVEDFNPIDYLRAGGSSLLRAASGSFVNRMLELDKYLFGQMGFLLMGAGLIAVPWGRRRSKSELLFFIYLLTFLPQMVGVFHPKRFFHYFPILLLWMGNGIEVLRNWARASFGLDSKRSFQVAFSACVFFAVLSASYVSATLAGTKMPLENKTMGFWMKENIPGIEEEYVAARHPSINFYSGSKILKLPYVDRFEDLLTFLQHRKTKYFVVSGGLDTPFLETYRFLLEESEPPPTGLSRKHTVHGNQKMILYEVLQ